MVIRKLLFAAAFVGLLAQCETEDVPSPAGAGPSVSLTINPLIISENGGSAQVVAQLDASYQSEVVVNLSFGGTAVGGTDYNVSGTTITIPANAITGSIEIAAVDDTLENGNINVVVSIASVTNGTNGSQPQTLIIEDDDAAPTAVLLINEVLYDPSNSGLDGDANGDGAYAQNEDEFIEFINLSSQPLDLSGYEIYDDENLQINTPNHTFPAGTVVPPGKCIVVFGGGTPTGSFGGAIVQTSTSGDLNMNNAGDFVTVKDANGTVVVTFDIDPLSNNPNESYTRNPDITGYFEQSSTNTPYLFSPGTKVDLSPF